jgi:hypothetical protein
MGELVERNFQGAFSACSICFADFFCNYSQIVDDANVFQLPDAMKVVDALLQSAQELLFDALSDVDVDKVVKCFNIREHHFIFFCSESKVLFPSNPTLTCS